MTRILLVLSVMAMFVLSGLVMYDAYRSDQKAQTKTEDSELEETEEIEEQFSDLSGSITYLENQAYGR